MAGLTAPRKSVRWTFFRRQAMKPNIRRTMFHRQCGVDGWNWREPVG